MCKTLFKDKQNEKKKGKGRKTKEKKKYTDTVATVTFCKTNSKICGE
jgi:stalled ribosome alternative rescue factor ArfA